MLWNALAFEHKNVKICITLFPGQVEKDPKKLASKNLSVSAVARNLKLQFPSYI